jgi:hypothetical protein
MNSLVFPRSARVILPPLGGVASRVKASKTSCNFCKVSPMWCAWISVMLLLGGFQTASAFTALDRAAAWSAWTNAFYYTSNGRGYLRTEEGSGSSSYFWMCGSEMEVVNAAVGLGLANTNMVNALCEGFTNQNTLNWTWDQYNDDVTGVARAFVGAFQVTGNTNWLMLAKYGFDLGYSRGFDPTNGGIYECVSGCTETAETVDGIIVPCYWLSRYLNDPTYLTKAQNLYGFLVTNEFVQATGMVEGEPNNGMTSGACSDYGFFIQDSMLLGYTNNAYLAAAYVTNHFGVGMSVPGGFAGPDGSSGFCLRAMGLTGVDTAFAQQSCDNAWSWQESRGFSEKWNYRESDTNIVQSYSAMDVPMGMLSVPPEVPPTLPVTAADVVGSQVTFSAAFGSTNAYFGLPAYYYGAAFTDAAIGVGNTYQWQFISGGVTNNIPGATSLTLTLSNLQLTNTGSYQLRASYGSTVAVSIPASLTVSNVPAPVNNVIISYAAQTAGGYGFGLTPTWTIPLGNIIYEQIPSSTNGNFDLEPYWNDRSVNSLTMNDGLTVCPGGVTSTTTSTNYVTCGNGSGAGSSVIYTITNTSVAGYNLTNITVYGGWKDNGRDQQAYTVYYSTVAAPTTFISLGSANYLPANPASVGCATRATFTPASGVLASNVAAVKFDFTTPASENGYCGYAGIALYGTPLSPVVGNGIYNIVNLNSGLLGEVKNAGITNSSPVDQWTNSGGANQQWELTNLGGGIYQILGVQSGLALDVVGDGTGNGTAIDIWPYNSSAANEQWFLTPTSGGYYRITMGNDLSNCLEVSGSGTTNGAPLDEWAYTGGNNQQWKFVPVVVNGIYSLLNLNSGLVADVHHLNTTNGTPVDQYAANGGANQQWGVTNLGGGAYKIIGIQSGRALSTDGGGSGNGTQMDVYDYSGASYQQWYFTATSGGYYHLSPGNATNSCLDVQHSGLTNDTPLQIWTSAGDNSQQWSFQAP